jgi:crotonobetainyl-CoA:carnitine CoA-transferase CaiB-like acyl-CoA transferase
VVTAHVDGAENVTLPSAPWRFSAATDQAPHQLGAFGADNDGVLADLLGLDPTAVADLNRRGVLRRDEAAVASPEPIP